MTRAKARGLLTIEELNVPVKTIRQWVYRGLIPNTKLNGLLRFDSEALDGWILQSSRGHGG
jgi:excisionase family DNA binding protein